MYIVALVIVTVVVIAAVAYVMWPDDEGEADPLYLHISFNVTTADVHNPMVKIFMRQCPFRTYPSFHLDRRRAPLESHRLL